MFSPDVFEDFNTLFYYYSWRYMIHLKLKNSTIISFLFLNPNYICHFCQEKYYCATSGCSTGGQNRAISLLFRCATAAILSRHRWRISIYTLFNRALVRILIPGVLAEFIVYFSFCSLFWPPLGAGGAKALSAPYANEGPALEWRMWVQQENSIASPLNCSFKIYLRIRKRSRFEIHVGHFT